MKIYVPSINIKGLNKEPDYEAIFASGYSAGYEDGYESYPCLKKMPLTVEVLSAGTIYWRGTRTRTIQYKKNKNDWTDITSSSAGAPIDVAAGDIVKFRGSNPSYEGSQLVLQNGSFNLLGNIMSLINATNFSSIKTLTTPNTFKNFFLEDTGIIDASNLLLPATTLTQTCYLNMFRGCTSLTAAPSILPATTLESNCYQTMFCECTSLTSAPELPATTLANNCYQQMFAACTSLTTAPELPATTLAEDCYWSMFYGCGSLTGAPALPAMTLAEGCYREMFRGCFNLTTPPELPATKMAENCYYGMFYYCTSLTTAPELPATTLANYCYGRMFNRCTSLTKAPSILPATTLAPNCYDSMFQYCTSLTTAPELPAPFSAEGCYSFMFGACDKLNYIKCLALGYFGSADFGMWASAVASSGTFVKDPNANNWPRGWNGIPTNWTIVDAS